MSLADLFELERTVSHYRESVPIWIFSGPYYSLNVGIHAEYGKVETIKIHPFLLHVCAVLIQKNTD